MAVDSNGITSGISPDLTALLQTLTGGSMNTDAGMLALANQGKGDNSGVGAIMPIAGLALLMRTMFPVADPSAAKALDANDVQNIVASNAAAQTANSNAVLLLKDIQDTGQGITAAITAAQIANQTATLQAEIASLQGQGQITTAIADTRYAVTNEVHEGSQDVISNANQNAATNLQAMNLLAASLSQGHAEINSNISSSKYDTAIAVMTDGDKTRTAIAALAASLPNARELDLQRQLDVALSDHRHTQTRGVIDSGNVSVVTNVNQAQSQAQQQQQLASLTGIVQGLANHQQAMATAITIGNGNRGGNQTPTNISQ